MPAPFAAADFVTNPATAVDDLANAVHAAAFDLLEQVLTGLRTQENVDPASAGFLGQYAGAAGLGLLVMAFLAVLAVVDSVRGGGGRDDLRESLFKYLPLAIFLIVFSPAIGVLVGNLAAAATEGVAQWGAGTVDGTRAKIDTLAAITADKLPGGTFVGLMVSALIVVGALGVFLVLAVQRIGMPVAGLVAGIGWAMLVHPAWRPKAARVPGVWLGLVFAKAVLFLILAAAFGAFGAAGGPGEGISALVRLCLLAVALLITGAVPLLLLRSLPGLRTRSSTRPSHGVPSGAPIGLHGPLAVVAERPLVGPVVSAAPEVSYERHTIERAYEQGQRDRGDVTQRGDGKRRASHLEASARTEAIHSPPDVRRQ